MEGPTVLTGYVGGFFIDPPGGIDPPKKWDLTFSVGRSHQVGRQHNPFELVMRVGFAKKNSDKNGPIS